MANNLPAHMRRPAAGFWLRLCAYLVDCVLLFIPLIALLFLAALTAQPTVETFLLILFFNVMVRWFYWARLESSTWQATVGKRLFNLQVTDLHGRQISFDRATRRYFASVISDLILGIGYVMVAFTDRAQCLHDILAGCLVLRQ